MAKKSEGTKTPSKMKESTIFAESQKEERKKKKLIVSRASSLALEHFGIGRALILQES